VVRVKLGFSEQEWSDTYNRLVTSAGVLGLTVGGPVAAWPMQFGRKNIIIGLGFVCLLGASITLIADVWCIIIGRFLIGFCSGIFLAVGPRMMDESVPQHLLSHFGSYTTVYISIGQTLC
jgi:MFS family permease